MFALILVRPLFASYINPLTFRACEILFDDFIQIHVLSLINYFPRIVSLKILLQILKELYDLGSLNMSSYQLTGSVQACYFFKYVKTMEYEECKYCWMIF